MIRHSAPLLALALVAPALVVRPALARDPSADLRRDVASFYLVDPAPDAKTIANAGAADFLAQNGPLIDLPDRRMERIYHFRWWTYRKHLAQTAQGWVVTEFLKPVGYAAKHGVISAPGGHHIREGRWLRDPRFMRDYLRFYLTDPQAAPRKYSFWIADSARAYLRIHPDRDLAAEMLPHLIANYDAWNDHRLPSRTLYWQEDMRDGMEWTVGGRLLNPQGTWTFRQAMTRPTINAYQYGDARAIARLAGVSGQGAVASDFAARADRLAAATMERLWNPASGFFAAMEKDYTAQSSPLAVRELMGFTPWYFHLPPDEDRYSRAWRQLGDPQGFAAPFGPTTVEQRHPLYTVATAGDLKPLCQWNGPSWPFATAQTLTGLANLLHDYKAHGGVDPALFRNTLAAYTRSHAFRQIPAPGDTGAGQLPRQVDLDRPWIDENLDPHTGNWLSRYRLHLQKADNPDRGKDYNHSTYADLILSGLIGIRPQDRDRLVIKPIIPPDWRWFAVERLRYRGHEVSIRWDRDGSRYGPGAGWRISIDGREVHRSRRIVPIDLPL